MPPRMEMGWRLLTMKYIQYDQNILILKTYKEVKPKSSKEREDKVVDVER